jgi:hypothetical protein
MLYPIRREIDFFIKTTRYMEIMLTKKIGVLKKNKKKIERGVNDRSLRFALSLDQLLLEYLHAV